MGEEEKAKWKLYSSDKGTEQRSAEDIGYEEASEYQQREFGPTPDPLDGERAYRLNRREGFSPTESDKPRIGGALASALDLPDHQKEQVYEIMGELNLAAFGSQRRIETVALGVITVVVNYDRFQRRQDPNATRIAESQEYRRLISDLGIDYSAIGTTKRVVKQELQKREYFDSCGGQ